MNQFAYLTEDGVFDQMRLRNEETLDTSKPQPRAKDAEDRARRIEQAVRQG